MKKFTALAIAMALASVPAAASAAEGSGIYVRGEVGNATLHIDGDSAVDTAMSGWVGYGFNSVFAIEGHYGSLGKDSEQGITIDMNAVGLGVRLKHEFAAGYYLAGRAGMERVENELSGPGGSITDEASEAYVGVGGGYNFTPNFAVTAYWDTRQVPFFGSDERVDTLTIGGEYRF